MFVDGGGIEKFPGGKFCKCIIGGTAVAMLGLCCMFAGGPKFPVGIVLGLENIGRCGDIRSGILLP